VPCLSCQIYPESHVASLPSQKYSYSTIVHLVYQSKRDVNVGRCTTLTRVEERRESHKRRSDILRDRHIKVRISG
jgi:hypothetical protein